MSFEATAQSGDIPFTEAEMELQQIALGMLLIWDTLEADYLTRNLAEGSILSDWMRKHNVGPAEAKVQLNQCKDVLMNNPWASILLCRTFKEEGWITIFLVRPDGNEDILHQTSTTLAYRPFPTHQQQEKI